MKSLDELKARSNMIPKLAVSEELLCARAEGLLSPAEACLVDSAVSHDPWLQELVNDAEKSRNTYAAIFGGFTTADKPKKKSKQ